MSLTKNRINYKNLLFKMKIKEINPLLLIKKKTILKCTMIKKLIFQIIKQQRINKMQINFLNKIIMKMSIRVVNNKICKVKIKI